MRRSWVVSAVAAGQREQGRGSHLWHITAKRLAIWATASTLGKGVCESKSRDDFNSIFLWGGG